MASFTLDEVPIGVPVSVLPALANLLGATYDNSTQFYTVPCEKRSSLPDLTFDFFGLQYRIPATEYVRNVSLRAVRNKAVLRQEEQCAVQPVARICLCYPLV